jgi:putative NIF3 family GTP cyclohydrolase 1 type 2
MKIKEIFDLAIQMGVEADLRGKDEVEKDLLYKQKKFNELKDKQKEIFDQESLTNPYSDSRILNVADDKEIKRVLIGIDIEPCELVMAQQLGNIDLVISHHPLGMALVNLYDVMEMQCDILHQYGVPINIAEKLTKVKISEVARGLNKTNYQRTVDAAKLLGINLVCIHTPCDNLAANFLKKKIDQENPERIIDLVDSLTELSEYKIAAKHGAGPKVFVGSPENKCGKIVLTEITGGTEGSPKIYEKMAQVGIGTVIGMHISEENKQEAENALINVIIAGHMSSDSLGVNLFLDRLEKKGIEILPCSGLTRFSRN